MAEASPAPERDARHMRRALELAEQGWGQTAPNPMVGAVVVRDGEVIAEGYHARYGEAHAEVNALRAAGDRARGATLYVSLEPCAHVGKTPPCTGAIIAAGISRVVAPVRDPSPVARGGVGMLRTTGVQVDLGVERERALEINAPFFNAHIWAFVGLAMAFQTLAGLACIAVMRRVLPQAPTYLAWPARGRSWVGPLPWGRWICRSSPSIRCCFRGNG